MSGSVIEDAFGHHVWATTRLIDVCLELPPEQLDTAVPGTYGSILDTQRHLVGSDAWYLRCITKDKHTPSTKTTWICESSAAPWSRTGPRWSELPGR